MNHEIVIYNPEDRKIATEIVRRIERSPLMVVTISEYKDDRSTAQNRLYWAWLTDCQNTENNEFSGNTKEEWHKYFKKNALLNIYIRDDVEGTASTMAAVYEVKISNDIDVYENLMDFIIKKISTTSANVAQFTEYLTVIERFCHYVGISLRTDYGMYKRAMGIK